MKTLVFDVNEMKWEKHPTFPGVYMKDVITKEHNMDVTNKYIKIEPKGEITVHTHDVTEAIYLLEGDASILVNGDRISLKAGNMIAAPESVLHGIKNETDKDIILLATFGVK